MWTLRIRCVAGARKVEDEPVPRAGPGSNGPGCPWFLTGDLREGHKEKRKIPQCMPPPGGGEVHTAALAAATPHDARQGAFYDPLRILTPRTQTGEKSASKDFRTVSDSAPSLFCVIRKKSPIASEAFKMLGCEKIRIFCEVLRKALNGQKRVRIPLGSLLFLSESGISLCS